MEFAKLIVVATDAELKIAQERFGEAGEEIIKTGVGGLNVIKALAGIDRNTPIVNFGFAGSNRLKIGGEYLVSKSKLYHPNVEYDEPEYSLNGQYPCFTSNDFVLSTDIKEPCLFDMELAYILALGFKNVVSLKIVSDSLNLAEYEEAVDRG